MEVSFVVVANVVFLHGEGGLLQKKVKGLIQRFRSTFGHKETLLKGGCWPWRSTSRF